MPKSKADWILLIPVFGAIATLPFIVPENPLLHLDDPSHWGVLGILLFVALFWRRVKTGRQRAPKRLLATFLGAMPLIYIANWIRFGGSSGWLVVEVLGLVLFGILVALGWWRGKWWFAAGIAAHAVWDAAHIGQTTFIPDWYAVGCAVADVAVAGYAAALCYLFPSRPGGAR